MAQNFSLLQVRTEDKRFDRGKFKTMANTRHPNFILGLISILVGAAAIGFYANKDGETGVVLLLITAFMGVVSWIWSIIEVQKNRYFTR